MSDVVEHERLAGLVRPAAIAFIAILLIFAATAARGAEEVVARVVKVDSGSAGGFQTVSINHGVKRGVIPGMKFDISRGGVPIGSIDIVKSEAERSMGVFKPACAKCRAEIGDLAALSGKSFSLIPPPILVPVGKKRPGAGPDPGFEALQTSFRQFMSGKPPVQTYQDLEQATDLPDPTPKRSLPACPPQTDIVEEYDEDIKAGYFLEHGDHVRVEDWPPYTPFCPVVDMNGYIRMPEAGLISTRKRTPAALEIALREKLAALGSDAKPVIIPIPAGYMPQPIEFFILGEVFSPGHYEFDSADMTVRRAVEIGGGSTTSSDGTAIVVDDLSKKWEFRLVRLKEAGQGTPPQQMYPSEPAGQPSPPSNPLDDTVRDRAVIFLPSSREHLEQFIREVLPYLPN